jgi:hypothetical protein
MQMIEEKIQEYFWWINERHWIYVSRNQGDEWPWTDDPILQKFKFTNVFRELDAGTVWLRENWRDDLDDHPDLFFNICLYRQFNLIATAEKLGYQVGDEPPNKNIRWRFWDADFTEKYLIGRKAQGNSIYTNSHMVSGTVGGGKGIPKITRTVRFVLDHMWDKEYQYVPFTSDSLENAFYRLLEAPGFGPFTTYEVITDLRHTRYLRNAPDTMTWANPGGGAMRGLNRLYGLSTHPKKQRSTSDYINDMRRLLDMSNERLEDHVPPLEMRDIEHSLCEYDKYARAKSGVSHRKGKIGKPRLKSFIPPHKRV